MIKMIKIYTVLFAFIVLLVSTAIAAPIEGDIKEEKNSVYNFMDQKLSKELMIARTRYRRATCQIPIIGDWVSDSACAAGCIARGRAGGHCRNEICHCREEKMLDLLRKRFNF
ncbi:defensin-1-like [Vespa velutina]|uniref:defensin-1-like n=1 Tax=Vespa velutina TaxID=202808 RepID=UPI001FB4E842|nr:defensin-1-like [Vespa velutina]XP_047353340.1 defensin-1-like [Vespa velutina]